MAWKQQGIIQKNGMLKKLLLVTLINKCIFLGNNIKSGRISFLLMKFWWMWNNIPNPTFPHIPHISYLRFRKSDFNSETCFISRKLNKNYLRKTLLLKYQYFKGLIFQLLHSKNQNFDFAGWELFFLQFFVWFWLIWLILVIW